MTPEQTIFQALTDAYWRTDDMRSMAKAAADSVAVTAPDYFALVLIIKRNLEQTDFAAMANEATSVLRPAIAH